VRALTFTKRTPYTASANAKRANATGVGSAIVGDVAEVSTGDVATANDVCCGGAAV